MSKNLTPMNWFVILLVITVGLALGLPPDPQSLQHLHTSSAMYRLAIAALLIPYAVIWYASFYAFAKLKEYSQPLSGKDGAAFRKITIGMGILAYGLLISTDISLLLNNVAAHHRDFEAAAKIINNYLTLSVPLLTFFFVASGSRSLLLTVKGWLKSFDLRLYMPIFIALSAIFVHLALNNQYVRHSYHLNVYVLLLTLVGPYLYAWFLGLVSAKELSLYARYVKGTLYRQAVKWFAYGITVVIVDDIIIQFVNVTFAQRVGNSLGALLLLDYVLLIFLAAGLVLMALGTKKLKKLEEV